MSRPDPLPIEAREAVGRLLWRRLLQEPPASDEPDEPAPAGAGDPDDHDDERQDAA